MNGMVNTPPWLLAKVDQLLARMKEAGATAETFAAMGTNVVMVYLTEPQDGATDAELEAWDTTCDNCGKQAKGTMYSGTHTTTAFGVKLVIAFGVCPECHKASTHG